MSLIGSVKFFDTKKGWGFITVLTQDLPQSNSEVFVHFSQLNVSEDGFKRLYPGEYVSFSLGKSTSGPKKGQDTCIDVSGVMGGPLLTDHPEHRFKIYPKVDHRAKEVSEPEQAPEEEEESGEDADEVN
jgi:cold shock CspA family protein